MLGDILSDTVLVNAGHGGEEVAVAWLKGNAVEAIEVGAHCTRYRLRKSGPWLSVLGGGHPLNIVLNSGSRARIAPLPLLGLTQSGSQRRRSTPEKSPCREVRGGCTIGSPGPGPQKMMPADPLQDAIDALKEPDYQRAVELLTHSMASPQASPQTRRAQLRSVRRPICSLEMSRTPSLTGGLHGEKSGDLQDEQGQKALRNLRREIAQAKAQRDHANAQKSNSRALLDRPPPPQEDLQSEDGLNLLLERANAHFDCDEPQLGIQRPSNSWRPVRRHSLW